MPLIGSINTMVVWLSLSNELARKTSNFPCYDMILVFRQGADSTPKNAMRRDKQCRKADNLRLCHGLLVTQWYILCNKGFKRRTEAIRSRLQAGSPDFLGLLFALLSSASSHIMGFSSKRQSFQFEIFDSYVIFLVIIESVDRVV